MTSRLSTRFASLKRANRAALVTYVMASDPDDATCLAILRGLPAAGADVIELGFPFSDPMADGVSIQLAAQRALKAGGSLRKTLELAKRFRETNADTPLILMGYANPIESMGYEAFAAAMHAAGADGAIIVDLPPEEDGPLRAAFAAHDLSIIRLATPTTDEKRLTKVLEGASGFLYYVSVAGVTGVKEAQTLSVAPAVERVRKASGLPVAVGFGVKTPERAASIARVADAVVAGSVLVDEVAAALEANEPAAPRVLAKVKALADAVRGARVAETV